MNYFVCALMPEARPIIDRYRLKRSEALPFALFEGKNTLLIICGMGTEAATIATAAMLGLRRPGSEDLLVNVGICGAPEIYPVGTLLLAHELRAGARRRYPDILFRHACTEVPIESVDEPLRERRAHPVDMEAFGIYRAAERFFETHRMLFFKVVSDHFAPDSVDKAAVPALIESVLLHLLEALDAATGFTRPSSLFDDGETERLEALRPLFTKSQYDTLMDACRYYRLRHGKALPPEIAASNEPMDKTGKKELLERFVARLTQ
jgi:hypothetical protein